MKILSVIGARPQFIKAAVVSAALKKVGIDEVLLHTGQHFDADMSDIFFDQLNIPRPNIMLDINGGGHGVMTGRMLEAIEAALIDHKPDRVLVYGDTNSTLAGALAAAKMHIPVAHVEAGLRSYNMQMPEEINRILTDQISDILFCPSDAAMANLSQEGFDHKPVQCIRTGDVMADTAQFFKTKAVRPSAIQGSQKFALCTLHRAENTDDPDRLAAITQALNALHHEHNIPVIMPLHPRTKNALAQANLMLDIDVIPPASYFEMMWLLDHASLVLTDSGGLQKESYLFDTPCVTLRDQTEWVELIDAGANTLAGADTQKIVQLAKDSFGKPLAAQPGLYGDGHAADFIAQTLLSA